MLKLLPLLLLSIPCFSQLSGTYTYHVKEVHNITIVNDSTWNWQIDTIAYQSAGEIKFSGLNISIDGIGNFKYNNYEARGENGEVPFYTLTNAGTLMKIENFLYLEYPVVNKKTKMIFFSLDNP